MALHGRDFDNEGKPVFVVEPARILRPQPAVPPQARPAPPPAPVRQFTPVESKPVETKTATPSRPFSSAYFLVIGGAIIGLAVAIAFISRKVG